MFLEEYRFLPNTLLVQINILANHMIFVRTLSPIMILVIVIMTLSLQASISSTHNQFRSLSARGGALSTHNEDN